MSIGIEPITAGFEVPSGDGIQILGEELSGFSQSALIGCAFYFSLSPNTMRK
jgi:hypothetical protein